MGEARISRDERFKKLRDAPKTPIHGSKPKIQKVPYMLRDHENFDKYYVPRAVAIGPFHHGNPRCELAEKFKLMLTSRFIEYTGQKDEDLYNKIKEKIIYLRGCYVDEATRQYDDETLAWMLFLDGCSTLQFIYSFMDQVMHEELEKVFKIKRDQIAIAQQDLFLLENQVPYEVLKLLMSSSNKNYDFKKAIESFVQNHIVAEKRSKGQDQQLRPGITANTGQMQQQSVTTNTEQKKQPGITTSTEQKQQPGITDTDQKHQPGLINTDQNQQPSVAITMENDPMENDPTHLLDLLRTRMLGPPKKKVQEKGFEEFRGQSFRNVQELDAAGIDFQPSESNFLGDISFTSLCFAGKLSLPKISVDDSTGPKFMNLIAYEMCPDFQNDFGVSSYIGFLDALIDHADDVKKLRSARVLFNLLGSDKEVAQLFNEIGTDLVPNTDLYQSVKVQIEKHYKTKWKTWMSQFCHDHFSSPWTILAFLGALSALGLSGIQTWYSVHSPPSP